MELDAFILIGGKSRRFGTDKAFFELDGETLASRAARIVNSALANARISYVASSENQFENGQLDSLKFPVVSDLKPGFGAWSGLHTALSLAQSDWVFLLACDLPFVSGNLVRLMCDLIGPNCDAVIPMQKDGRLQPLCAIYNTKTCLLEVEKNLRADGFLQPLHHLASQIKTCIVPFEDIKDLADSEEFFRNINSLIDLD